jgi:hypothetical protein
MCCDGCPSAYHPDCMGLAAAPTESWYCPACVQAGREPPGYRQSALFRDTQRGMEATRLKMREQHKTEPGGLVGWWGRLALAS